MVDSESNIRNCGSRDTCCWTLKAEIAIVGRDEVESNNSCQGFHRVQQQVPRLLQFLILDEVSTINCIIITSYYWICITYIGIHTHCVPVFYGLACQF